MRGSGVIDLRCSDMPRPIRTLRVSPDQSSSRPCGSRCTRISKSSHYGAKLCPIACGDLWLAGRAYIFQMEEICTMRTIRTVRRVPRDGYTSCRLEDKCTAGSSPNLTIVAKRSVGIDHHFMIGMMGDEEVLCSVLEKTRRVRIWCFEYCRVLA